jgi:hypothetical protein
MDKGLFFYLMIFAALIGAGLYQANSDEITPAIVQAQAEMTIGVAPVQVIEKGASLLLKLLAGATFAGIAAAVFSEFKKFYKTWQRNATLKRWQGGPNAQWKGPEQSQPKLRREDLMLLALSGRMPVEGVRNNPRPGVKRLPVEDDDIDLEF